VEAAGPKVNFSDGTEIDVRSVVWATGFGVDHSWVDVPVFDNAGRLEHRRGVTGSPGLYFLGLTGQHTRGSALLGWVKADAQFIARQIAAFRPNAPAETGGTPARLKNVGQHQSEPNASLRAALPPR
jgi:putative flavoprotein involved in K+ transport